MGTPVKASDYADQEIRGFFDGVTGLRWIAVDRVPPDIARAAEEFAQSNPRPSSDELRLHIDHAVEVARGWDHPDHHDLMLHTAVKSFYNPRLA